MLNVVLELSFYLCLFNILKKTTISAKIRDLILILYICEVGSAFGKSGPNYIPFSTIFVMLIVISNIYFKDNLWRCILNGLFAALALLSYQKAGAAAVLIIFLYEIFSKGEIKKSKKIKNLCISALSMIAVVGIYLLYLIITKNIYNFFDMTVLSIGEFSGSNFSFNPNTIIKIIVFEILTISFFIVLLKFKKLNNVTILLFISSIATLVYMYPIINEYHSHIWLTFLIPFFTSAINLTFDGVDDWVDFNEINFDNVTIEIVMEYLSTGTDERDCVRGRGRGNRQGKTALHTGGARVHAYTYTPV